MFSFFDTIHNIIEKNIIYEVAQKKYHNKIMIVINGHVENRRIRGDIIAILTPEEFDELDKPDDIAPRFSIWEGDSIRIERLVSSVGIIS